MRLTLRAGRLFRLMVLAAVVVATPVSGMTAGGATKACAMHETSGTAAHPAGNCCTDQQQPCHQEGDDCGCITCVCPTGCGHAHVMGRGYLQMPSIAIFRTRIGSSDVTPVAASAPEGQWRPPRSLH